MLKQTFIASASELQSSDSFLTVKTVMFSVPTVNANGVQCTEAFLSEIVENMKNYETLPLYADITNLVRGNYEQLGHCYNPVTETFSTHEIGSFYHFEKETDEETGVTSLIGYARVWKRNKSVCEALGELFAMGKLKFSFEVACGSVSKKEDGTIVIDADEKNHLEGMCVVSFPAYPDAVAMQLVAEVNAQSEEAEEMPKKKNLTVAEAAAEETVVEAAEVEGVEASTEAEETAEVVAEENSTEVEAPKESSVEATAETEAPNESLSEATAELEATEIAQTVDDIVAEEAESEAVNAELVVTRTVETREAVHTYDTETGEEAHEVVDHELTVTQLAEDMSKRLESIENDVKTLISESVNPLKEALDALTKIVSELTVGKKEEIQTAEIDKAMDEALKESNVVLSEISTASKEDKFADLLEPKNPQDVYSLL